MLQKNIALLEVVKDQDLDNDFILCGIGAIFRRALCLSIKMMKEKCNVKDDSIFSILKAAYKSRIIDLDNWIKMLELSKMLQHDYDSRIIKQNYKTIITECKDTFIRFSNKIDGCCDQNIY